VRDSVRLGGPAPALVRSVVLGDLDCGRARGRAGACAHPEQVSRRAISRCLIERAAGAAAYGARLLLAGGARSHERDWQVLRARDRLEHRVHSDGSRVCSRACGSAVRGALGASGAFWRVELPLARRGILAGLTLGFARSLGDFGVTLMVAGNIPGRTQTAALSIYDALEAGRDREAAGLAAILTTLSVLSLYAINRLGRK
jgi:hypothetical protein